MVVGLAFNERKTLVAMVHKQKGPPCVIGNWNGVGGKIEKHEMAVAAMTREFHEETGVLIPTHHWHNFAKLVAPTYDLFFFSVFTDEVMGVRTPVGGEPIRLWDTGAIVRERHLMDNIRWMIPFLLDADLVHDLGTLYLRR
ncbi:MAG: NUDIX domain-containing protein [Phycisphaerales bacterium]|nr:NUDIX domain-containing protein [Phycisphaerales bacterium]